MQPVPLSKEPLLAARHCHCAGVPRTTRKPRSRELPAVCTARPRGLSHVRESRAGSPSAWSGRASGGGGGSGGRPGRCPPGRRRVQRSPSPLPPGLTGFVSLLTPPAATPHPCPQALPGHSPSPARLEVQGRAIDLGGGNGLPGCPLGVGGVRAPLPRPGSPHTPSPGTLLGAGSVVLACACPGSPPGWADMGSWVSVPSADGPGLPQAGARALGAGPQLQAPGVRCSQEQVRRGAGGRRGAGRTADPPRLPRRGCGGRGECARVLGPPRL